jgi:hypothetical protein
MRYPMHIVLALALLEALLGMVALSVDGFTLVQRCHGAGCAVQYSST